MCDDASPVATSADFGALFVCNPTTKHYTLLCPNSDDDGTRGACLVWNSQADPEGVLGPPAVDGPTRFACFDPSSSNLALCKGTCAKGLCVVSPAAQWTTWIIIAVIVAGAAVFMYALVRRR